MKKTLCLLAGCAIATCLTAKADTLYPGLTITSSAVLEPPGGRLIIPVIVDNGTKYWARVYTTSSQLITADSAYDERFPYIGCSQTCIGQDLDLADFPGVKPHSTAIGIADEFDWSLNAPVGYEWIAPLDGEFHSSTSYLGPPVINGTFQIDLQSNRLSVTSHRSRAANARPPRDLAPGSRGRDAKTEARPFRGRSTRGPLIRGNLVSKSELLGLFAHLQRSAYVHSV
jgi:hypothetical protein